MRAQPASRRPALANADKHGDERCVCHAHGHDGGWVAQPHKRLPVCLRMAEKGAQKPLSGLRLLESACEDEQCANCQHGI
eukprot:6211735-Pleurochrysis_carterae.AAC.2